MAKFKPITNASIELPDPDLFRTVIYEGAHIEFEFIKMAIRDLPREGVITEFMREALMSHLGSSKIILEDGTYKEAITMAGYITTPEGRTVPAAKVARTINVGTNLAAPTRFISKAVNASRRPAEEIMRLKGEEILRRTGGK